MSYQDRKFMIFNISELNQIDFNEVLETSIDTIRKSIDQTKTFIKWEGSIIPNSILNLTTKQGPYNYAEILSIVSTAEWKNPNIIP